VSRQNFQKIERLDADQLQGVAYGAVEMN